MTRIRSMSLVLCLSSGFACTFSFAQTIDLTPLASMGGQLHAAAAACNLFSSDQLQKLKAKQKSEMMAKGVSAENYEKHFKLGHDKALDDLKTMTPEQKTQVCQQLDRVKPPVP